MSKPAREGTNLREYEVSFIVKDDEGIRVLRDLLARHGAEIILEGPQKTITLAYPIKKELEADFSYFRFLIEPQKIMELENEIKLQPKVLRFLLIKPGALKGTKFEKTAQGIPERPMPQASSLPLSNEALEKKIEEILQ